MHDVLIIGAGAAGLIAAKSLHSAGFHVAICEARDRIGGRIQTTYQGHNPIELGAEFVHGRPPVTLDLVREAGLELVECLDSRLHRQPDGLHPMPEFWDVIRKVDSQFDAGRDETYEEFLAHAQASPSEKRLARSFTEGFNAAHASRIGTTGLATADGAAENIDGEKQYRIRSGYRSLIEWLVRQIPAETIHLNTAIREIRWQRGQVQLLSESGGSRRTYEATCAVMTVPLGVLKASPPERGAITFDPPLTSRAEVLKHLHVGQVVKVTIRFRESFWKAFGSFGYVQADRSAFPTWWPHLSDTSHILTGWAGGAKADALAGFSPEDLINEAVASLSEIFAESPERIRELMTEIHFHDWRADPFSRGAYSYPGVGGIAAARRLADPCDDTLFFAGEATDFQGAFGTVHGALDSGLRAARDIIAKIQPLQLRRGVRPKNSRWQ